MSEPCDFWKRDLHPQTPGERVAAELIVVTWEPAPEDASESHRGLYRCHIPGTELCVPPPSGWYAMEDAARHAQQAYRVIADAIDRQGV